MTTVADRLRMITMRLGFGSLVVAIFGLGSVGAFLLFDWRPLLRQVAIAYLAAAVLFRLTLVLGRVVLVPNGTVDLDDLARFRVVPMPAEHARFWQRRLGLFIGYWAFGRATAAVSQGDRARPELRGRLRHGSVVPCLAQAQRLVG
jgi:moderate conductance mechanosensitive channel